jgi:thiamine-phosphate diphosphorylase
LFGARLLSFPVICLVTDGSACAEPDLDGLVLERIAAAVRGGVNLVQLRERHLDDRALCRAAERCRSRLPADAAVVVNDRFDIALAAGADGVHLPAASLPTRRLRAIWPERFLVGRSIHGIEEAAVEGHAGADYLLFGTVYASRSKPADTPIAGVQALRTAVLASPVPVLAIGGISLERVPEVAQSGAAGFAAISLFLEADDPEAVARHAREILMRSQSSAS